MLICDRRVSADECCAVEWGPCHACCNKCCKCICGCCACLARRFQAKIEDKCIEYCLYGVLLVLVLLLLGVEIGQLERWQMGYKVVFGG